MSLAFLWGTGSQWRLQEAEREQSRLVFKGSVGSRRQSLMFLVKDRYYIPSYFARRLLFSGLCFREV